MTTVALRVAAKELDAGTEIAEAGFMRGLLSDMLLDASVAQKHILGR
ncbi:hypothetical protein FOXB_03524 [Fusarium oxysporum f. sp. conglutinans Fo5176]|uniref:Uncharacterized protein n=1 Tax=Fusarium oxysporum (strain Fo5176) TaxID=660025 RepID=F9FAU8_FUSOF|nr:hypothetical protein FOXB_03524 [Fusarium oxysporum f. sp. conglutinans Fo5176]